MKLRTSALAVALSLLPLGQTLLIGALGITTATTAVLLQTSAALAQDASVVARIAKAITVRIEGATQGSGVLVKKEGNRYTVLTAWHVVESNRPGEELAIFTPDGKEHQLEQGSIQRLGEVDMAVLTFSSGGAYEVAEVGDIKKVKHDQPIYVAGFPLNNSQNLRYEPGEVVANAEVGIDQGYQLLYDNKTESGMSGGVLLNADGKLIGLHGRGEQNEQMISSKSIILNYWGKQKNEQELLDEKITGKTGVNQGVPISYYKSYSKGSPVVVIKKTATTAGEYLALVKSLIGKRGTEQTVIRLCEQGQSLSPTILQATNLFEYSGMTKFIISDNQEGLTDLNKAIEISPRKSSLYDLRGFMRKLEEDYQGAIVDFNTAIEIDPKRASAYINRGETKNRLNDNQGADADYTKAIQVSREGSYFLAHSYTRRGMLRYKKLMDYQGALSDFNRALESKRKDTMIVYHPRGSVKLQLGDYKGAISDLNKAVEWGESEKVRPRQLHEAYNNRGIAKGRLGDEKGAFNDYSMAIAINPEYAESYNNRGISRSHLGDMQGAVNDYNQALILDPRNSNAYRNRGVIRLRLNDPQGAIIDLNKALTLNPRDARAYVNRGTARFRIGDSRGTCRDYKHALSLVDQISRKQRQQIASSLPRVCN